MIIIPLRPKVNTYKNLAMLTNGKQLINYKSNLEDKRNLHIDNNNIHQESNLLIRRLFQGSNHTANQVANQSRIIKLKCSKLQKLVNSIFYQI